MVCENLGAIPPGWDGDALFKVFPPPLKFYQVFYGIVHGTMLLDGIYTGLHMYRIHSTAVNTARTAVHVK